MICANSDFALSEPFGGGGQLSMPRSDAEKLSKIEKYVLNFDCGYARSGLKWMLKARVCWKDGLLHRLRGAG